MTSEWILYLVEAVEDPLLLLRRQPDAGVGDSNLDAAFCAYRAESDSALGRCKLERIAEQIGDDLFDPLGIEQVIPDLPSAASLP